MHGSDYYRLRLDALILTREAVALDIAWKHARQGRSLVADGLHEDLISREDQRDEAVVCLVRAEGTITPEERAKLTYFVYGIARGELARLDDRLKEAIRGGYAPTVWRDTLLREHLAALVGDLKAEADALGWEEAL